MRTLAPTTTAELCEAVAAAAAEGNHLEIRAGGSKADIGAQRNVALLDLRRFCGVVDYDPPELVLTVRAATPLTEIEALVESQHQALAFEPWDHGPLFGRPVGAATIGGVVAAAVAGPGRAARGGARDHLLGVKAVSGRAEAFVAGARVVKNVTGYDVPKLMAGSWGRLAAMTELTLKVGPRPRASLTLGLHGLVVADAIAAMARALGSPLDVSAAAHLPPELHRGQALTLIRLQGFERSVAARAAKVPALLRAFGSAEPLGRGDADAYWGAIREAAPLAALDPLWRIQVPPSGAVAVIQTLEPLGAQWFCDWAGALIWLSLPGHSVRIREAAAAAGGHAMLVRAGRDLRNTVPALHPRSPALSALEGRIRRAFDPAGVFETARFLD
jgi:glycolate oxidase FAD binding subunit